MRKFASVLACLAAALTAGQASAHHSFAKFDMGKTVAITGTIRDFQWVNPHSWIHMTVQRADGSVEEWAMECGSPNMMIRWGWKASDIKPGQKVTIDVHPARDGDHQGAVYLVFLPNGKVLADPMGRQTRSREFAEGPPPTPSKPTGTPYN